MKGLCLIILVLATGSAGALPSAMSFSASDQRIYQELLADFPNEIQTFDQTTESPSVLQEFRNDWHNYIASGAAFPEKWLSGYSFSKDLKLFLQPPKLTFIKTHRGDLETISPIVDHQKTHSIGDSQSYAKERIGDGVFSVLKRNSLSAIVYAGARESAPSALKIKPTDIKYLPSSYTSWGLHKAFVSGTAFSDGRARYLLIIPPSKQYLIHYVEIFRHLEIPVTFHALNRSDREILGLKYYFEFNEFKRGLANPPDVIVLGYYKQFQGLLGGELQRGAEQQLGMGITAQAAIDKRGQKAIRYLFLKSDFTIWGELSASLLDSTLLLNPKAVLFMGSSGGVSDKTGIYDVSVPEKFVLNGNVLPLENEVIIGLGSKGTITPGIILGSKHGHTNSPMEQTQDFVKQQNLLGVDTFDVEQNLIAEIIFRHNKTFKANVLFGAINLITDKPTILGAIGHPEFDLTKIDSERKAAARVRAVIAGLLAFRQSESLNKVIHDRTCEWILPVAL